jgi:UTP--glucose-1-phosphate uridylyltransferase
MKIKKAIIPAAGLGTRFLPATKAQPKEMLPIVDTPAIQFIIEEAVQSGIEEILVVTGRGKRAIEDHFDKSLELEELLALSGKYEELEVIQRISRLADIHYIRQKEPKGLGHAIWCARKFIGNEPFAVMLGDDVVQSKQPCLKQLMNVYEIVQSSVIGVQNVAKEEVGKYGIIEPIGELEKGLYEVKGMVEKPNADEAPSNLAIMARYILTPAILDILGEIKPGQGNEIQLTDGLQQLAKSEKVYAYEFEGKRYDIGDKLGFIQATIEYALKRKELREPLVKWIKENEAFQ